MGTWCCMYIHDADEAADDQVNDLVELSAEEKGVLEE